MENKNAFFYLDIQIPDQFVYSNKHMKELDDGLDMVLYAMHASNNDIHKIIYSNGQEQSILFRANTKKRIGQLNKLSSRYLNPDIKISSKGIFREDILASIRRAEHHDYTGKYAKCNNEDNK